MDIYLYDRGPRRQTARYLTVRLRLCGTLFVWRILFERMRSALKNQPSRINNSSSGDSNEQPAAVEQASSLRGHLVSLACQGHTERVGATSRQSSFEI